MQQLIRPLKIAFFVEGMYASGVDTSTHLLSQALRQLGHQVVLFTPWEEHCRCEPPEHCFLLSARRINPKQAVYLTYPISLSLIKKFRTENFDLIHIHTSTTVNLLAWQVAQLFDLPIVYTYHTMSKEYTHYLGRVSTRLRSLMNLLVEKFDKLICNRANLVLTPSAKAADYLAEIGLSSPVAVIPNGIDLKTFFPYASDYLQTQFGVPSNAKILLFVGRLNQEKRPLLAYNLFRQLSRQRDDLCLVMVGNGVYRDELLQRAAQDGLQARLFLTGLIHYAAMPDVYNSADLWISTSQSEVHPMAALEAVACGLPVVALRDKALEGIVENGINGFIADSNESFIDQLQLLLQSPKLYRSMARAAVERIQAYSIETTAHHMLLAYQHVISTTVSSQHRLLSLMIRRPWHRAISAKEKLRSEIMAVNNS